VENSECEKVGGGDKWGPGWRLGVPGSAMPDRARIAQTPLPCNSPGTPSTPLHRSGRGAHGHVRGAEGREMRRHLHPSRDRRLYGPSKSSMG